MKRSSRISEIIDFKKLERESRKILYVGFVIGVIAHVVAGIFITFEKIEITRIEKKPYRAIPTRLIFLPPSIRNPYEDWERKPSKRKPGRQVYRFRLPSRWLTETAPLPSDALEKQLSRPDNYFKDTHTIVEVEIPADLPDEIKALIDLEPFVPEPYFKDLSITRKPENWLSMKDELLTLDDIDKLDIYKGFVIQDPTGKQNIKGFIHIPECIYEYDNPIRRTWVTSYKLPVAVKGLAEAVNLYTGIDIKVDRPLDLIYDELFSYPVLYITIDLIVAFEISSQRAKNFGEYLRNGGFAIIENGRPWKKNSPAKLTLLNIVREALGEDFKLQPIPYNHPVYHCFFDIEDLPLEGAENWSIPLESKIPDWGELLHKPEITSLMKHLQNKYPDLFGIWINERLVGIYSDKGYGHYWHKGVFANKYTDFSSGNETKYNFSQQLKLGVNMIVYAMIQQGGIARRFIDIDAQRRTSQ
ncbi:DUF4159 domain-containing protein [Candidatus Latescibacterota bacterium]